MNRKRLIFILALVAVLAATAAITLWVIFSQKESEQEMQIKHPVDKVVVHKEKTPKAEPKILGKWQNVDNPQWYKVYYDDYDEEAQMFWGKEWYENDDVHEEDLTFHGNGWFRWKKKGKVLHEYATMSIRDVPVSRIYKIERADGKSLIYHEQDRKKKLFYFSRVE